MLQPRPVAFACLVATAAYGAKTEVISEKRATYLCAKPIRLDNDPLKSLVQATLGTSIGPIANYYRYEYVPPGVEKLLNKRTLYLRAQFTENARRYTVLKNLRARHELDETLASELYTTGALFNNQYFTLSRFAAKEYGNTHYVGRWPRDEWLGIAFEIFKADNFYDFYPIWYDRNNCPDCQPAPNALEAAATDPAEGRIWGRAVKAPLLRVAVSLAPKITEAFDGKQAPAELFPLHRMSDTQILMYPPLLSEDFSIAQEWSERQLIPSLGIDCYGNPSFEELAMMEKIMRSLSFPLDLIKNLGVMKDGGGGDDDHGRFASGKKVLYSQLQALKEYSRGFRNKILRRRLLDTLGELIDRTRIQERRIFSEAELAELEKAP